MSGTITPYGWPYPTGTDLVRDGDNAIEALGRAIAATMNSSVAKLGMAYGAVGGGVADVNGALVVTYGRTFLSIPAVTVTVRDAAILAVLLGSQQYPNQCTVLFKTLAGAARPGAIEFSWIAVGPVVA